MLWHFTLQSRFALAEQLPLQLASHFAEHVADGGVPVHFALQCAPHVALQDAAHWLLFAFEEHSAWQLPSQSASHDPWQLKLPGFAMQLASHDALQLPVQLASTVAVH